MNSSLDKFHLNLEHRKKCFKWNDQQKSNFEEAFAEYLKRDFGYPGESFFYDAVIVLSRIHQMAHEDRHKLIDCMFLSCHTGFRVNPHSIVA